MERALGVQFIQLHKLYVESNVGFFLLGEERGGFELFSQPRRTALLDSLDQPWELPHVFTKHSKSRLGNLDVVEDVLRIFSVLVREIASYESRHNFHGVYIDKVEPEVEGRRQSFIKFFLFAHPRKHDHLT